MPKNCKEYILTLPEDSWKPKHSNQTSKVKAVIDVKLGMSKDPNYKMLIITSTDSYVSTLLHNDTSHHKGWFTTNAEYFIIPGKISTEDINYYCNPANDFTKLNVPEGMELRSCQPSTINKSTDVKVTTGWTFGASVEGGKPGVSASYSESNEISVKYDDFECANSKYSNISRWFYNYSESTSERGLAKFFTKGKLRWDTIISIASLAKGTLILKNEVAYIIPKKYNHKQDFTVAIRHAVADLKVNSYYSSDNSISVDGFTYCKNFSIPLEV